MSLGGLWTVSSTFSGVAVKSGAVLNNSRIDLLFAVYCRGLAFYCVEKALLWHVLRLCVSRA